MAAASGGTGVAVAGPRYFRVSRLIVGSFAGCADSAGVAAAAAAPRVRRRTLQPRPRSGSGIVWLPVSWVIRATPQTISGGTDRALLDVGIGRHQSRIPRRRTGEAGSPSPGTLTADLPQAPRRRDPEVRGERGAPSAGNGLEEGRDPGVAARAQRAGTGGGGASSARVRASQQPGAGASQQGWTALRVPAPMSDWPSVMALSCASVTHGTGPPPKYLAYHATYRSSRSFWKLGRRIPWVSPG